MNWQSLSWTINGKGEKSSQFDLEKIKILLKEILNTSGTLTLDGENEQGFNHSLQLRAEQNAYLVTLGYETEEDWLVETLTSQNSKGQKINILGDEWADNLICHDQNIVSDLFLKAYQNFKQDS